MKKEIDAIKSKDITQGGLTQGQQTQIARNEQRMSQILEELESLKETLNESIQESLGARSGKRHSKNKGAIEDEDEASSGEDDFYDCTKKKKPIQKAGENKSVETADTLLAIISEMESKASLLLSEKNKVLIPEVEQTMESGDALDAYMTGLSTQLVVDYRTTSGRNIFSSDRARQNPLLAENCRFYRRSFSKTKSNEAGGTCPVTEKLPVEKMKSATALQKPKDGPVLKIDSPSITTTVTTQEPKTGVKESKPAVYMETKPVWLGATDDIKTIDSQPMEIPLDTSEPDQFVDYKDRKMILARVSNSVNSGLDIEYAAPGLIIRKRKHAEQPKEHDDKAPETAASMFVEIASTAADAVALLLKHKKGYLAPEDHESTKTVAYPNKSRRKVVGPERPKFLENDNPD